MKLCSAFICCLLLGSLIAGPVSAQLPPGETAPDFSARTLDDQEMRLSELKGQPLLIEMGTTWCPSCNEVAHQIDGIRTFLKENKVSYVSVYLADSAESIQEHLAKEKLAAADQTLIDNGEARRVYGVFSIPRLILIDQNFKIVFDEMVLDAAEIKRRIKSGLQ